MSSLSAAPTPSPTFPRAIFSFLAFVFFPLLCLIWTIKCLRARKSEFLLFALLGTIGAWLAWLPFEATRRDLGPIWILGSIIAYGFVWAVSLIFLGMVKDEIEAKQKRNGCAI